MTKIFIAEDIPSHNKGEAAILFGMLETFKVLGNIDVSLLSLTPEIDRANYATIKVIDGSSNLHIIDNFTPKGTCLQVLESAFALLQYLMFAICYKVFGSNAQKIMRKEIWKEYCKADLIIIGHDGTFGSPLGGHTLCFSHICNILIANIFKKPVVIYAGDVIPGGNIGVLKKKLWGLLYRVLLNKVDLITLREELSYDYLQEIGVSKHSVHVTADTAFLLKPASTERVERIFAQENIIINKNPIIGMTVTQHMFRHAFSIVTDSKEKYNLYIRLMAEVVDHLTATLNATVVFLPHCIGPGEKFDDRIVAKDIYEMAKNKSHVKVIVNEYTASELKGVISQFDLFIGERTHSVIGSTSMYVPSLSITFSLDHRTHGIIGKMLGQKKWIYNIETLDFDSLISKIDNLWFEREGIKKDLTSKVDTVKKRALLNGELLKSLLKGNKQ